jgi:hypothetical protein
MWTLPTKSCSPSTHPYQTEQPDAATTATKFTAGNCTAIASTHPNRNQRVNQTDRIGEGIESAETLINQTDMDGEDRRRVDGPERRTPARPEPAPVRTCSTVRWTASETPRRPAGEATADGAGSWGRNQGRSFGVGRDKGVDLEDKETAGGLRGYTDMIVYHNKITEIGSH